jgi:hypothetical protein
MRASSRQFLKSQNRSSDHITERIQEQVTILSAIEPEAHFFEVGRQMLCTHMMPSSAHATLEQREGVFDGIRVNVTSRDVHVSAVIDGLVFFSTNASPLHCEWIGPIVIGHDHVFADVLRNVFRESTRFHVFGME